MQWYYANGGQARGPVEESELQRLAREGQLAATDLVWHAGLGNQWVAAGTINPQWFVKIASPASSDGPVTELSNRELMQRGRASLQGRWGLAVGLSVLYALMINAGGYIPYLGSIFVLLMAGPMVVGLATVFLKFAHRQQVGIGDLFSGFSAFGRNLGAYLLMNLFVFLWMLLLIIPGLIAAYGYAMTPYILAEDPNVGAQEALRRSKVMMRGNKWKMVCLGFRFFGWMLLGFLTLGIGFLWLVPYAHASMAQFYLNVSRRARVL